MSDKTKLLTDQARLLSPKERVELVEQILSTLDTPDGQIDTAWAQEAESRLKAYRAGDISSRPFTDILAKYSNT